MKKLCRLIAVFLVLTSASGCGQGWHSILHDLLVWYNEVSDNFLKITDEDSAKQMRKTQFKTLGLKREKLTEKVRNRLDLAVKVNDKEDMEALGIAQLDYFDEFVATAQRWKGALARLNEIVKNNPSNNTELKKVMGLDWQAIGNVSPADRDWIMDIINGANGVFVPKVKK